MAGNLGRKKTKSVDFDPDVVESQPRPGQLLSKFEYQCSGLGQNSADFAEVWKSVNDSRTRKMDRDTASAFRSAVESSRLSQQMSGSLKACRLSAGTSRSQGAWRRLKCMLADLPPPCTSYARANNASRGDHTPSERFSCAEPVRGRTPPQQVAAAPLTKKKRLGATCAFSTSSAETALRLHRQTSGMPAPATRATPQAADCDSSPGTSASTCFCCCPAPAVHCVLQVQFDMLSSRI